MTSNNVTSKIRHTVSSPELTAIMRQYPLYSNIVSHRIDDIAPTITENRYREIIRDLATGLCKTTNHDIVNMDMSE